MNKATFRVLIFSLSFTLIPLSVFAQSQSPCSGSVSIIDPTQAQPGVLAVVSNSSQAAFTVTGPATYHGSGYYWVQQGIPAGTYTITWNAVSGCGTPSSETNATDNRGSVAFAGNYQSTAGSSPNPPSPTQASIQSPAGHFLTIESDPPTASVYIRGSLMGKAPVKVQVPENVPFQIKCALNGYADYTYTYPAVGPLPAGVNTVNSEWTCALTKKPILQSSPSLSLPAQTEKPVQNSKVTTTPAQPTPAPSYVPPDAAKPHGFLSRFFTSIASFFRNLFGQKNNLPPPNNASIPNNADNSFVQRLQGTWNVDQISLFDPTLNSFRQITAERKYIEFSGSKVCPNGRYLPDGTPLACEHYNEFRTTGNKIMSDGLPAGQTITFRFSGEKLELAIEPENKTIARAQKITLSKIGNIRAETPQEKHETQQRNITPKSAPSPKVFPSTLTKPATQTPQAALNPQDLEGIWLLDLAMNKDTLHPAAYIQFKGNILCPAGLTDESFDLTACPPRKDDQSISEAIFGSLPFTLSRNTILFNFDGKQFVWNVSRLGTQLELTKNYDIDSMPIYGKPDAQGNSQGIGQHFYAKSVSSEKHILTKCDGNLMPLVKKTVTGTYAQSSSQTIEKVISQCKQLQL